MGSLAWGSTCSRRDRTSAVSTWFCGSVSFRPWSRALRTSPVTRSLIGRRTKWVGSSAEKRLGRCISVSFLSDPQGTLRTGMRTDIDYSFGPENTYLHLAMTAGVPAMLGLLTLGVLLAFAISSDPSFGWMAPVFVAFGVGSFFVITLGDTRNAAPALFLVAMARRTSVEALEGRLESHDQLPRRHALLPNVKPGRPMRVAR